MKAIDIIVQCDEAKTATVKFGEQLPEGDYLATLKLGNVYVPKATLALLGWEPNQALKVTLTPVV